MDKNEQFYIGTNGNTASIVRRISGVPPQYNHLMISSKGKTAYAMLRRGEVMLLAERSDRDARSLTLVPKKEGYVRDPATSAMTLQEWANSYGIHVLAAYSKVHNIPSGRLAACVHGDSKLENMAKDVKQMDAKLFEILQPHLKRMSIAEICSGIEKFLVPQKVSEN